MPQLSTPPRSQVRHCKLLSSSVLVTLSVIILISLSQRFHNQQTQLTQTSQMVAHGLTRSLENTETILLSLAEELHSAETPDLERLQQRMHHASRFIDSITRIVLIKQQRVILDSKHNQLQGEQISILEPVSAVHKNAGIQIGGTLPPELANYGAAGSQIPMHLHVPTTNGLHRYTFLLTFNTQSIIDLYEASPTSMAGRYALIRSDGTVLLDRTAEPRWSEQVQQLYSSPHDSQLLRQCYGIFPVQLSQIQLVERYPLAVVRNLDYLCSLRGWLQQNTWLVGLLLLSLLMTITATIRQSRAAQATCPDLLSHSISHWHQPVLIIDNMFEVQYSNNAALQCWPLLQHGQVIQPCNRQGTPVPTHQVLTQLTSNDQWQGSLQPGLAIQIAPLSETSGAGTGVYSDRHFIILPDLAPSGPDHSRKIRPAR